MSETEVKRSTWADEIDEDDNSGLPPTEVKINADNTKTVISYRINPTTGKKVRVTQKIREIRIKEKVDHAVAERKKWVKYGLEKGSAPGPNFSTTGVGENLVLKLGLRAANKAEVEEEDAERAAKEAVPGKKVVCRTCGGEHFTSRCPYKDALGSADSANEGSEPSTSRFGTPQPESAAPATSGSVYVAPHQRGKPPGTVLTDPGRTPLMGERDDSATLRVTNLSEDIVEDELRHLFGRFGRINRCHLVRDRETGRNRGFAFVSYETRDVAERACEKLNGFAFDNLIMHVEFSKK